MIELDGRSYVVNTPTENAYAILEYVNQYMADNDIKDKNGEVVQFKISLASPIWLLTFGIGYMATVCQKIMYAVANAFNISSCSEQQVLNLAKVARLSRKQGSYTTIVCSVSASGGTCEITTDLEAKATYEGVEYTFHPLYAETIGDGYVAEVILICTVTGPVFLESGAITAFTKSVPNLGSIVSSASQPGSGVESIEDLRTRLYSNEAISPLVGAIQGINALDGVTRAVVLYNSNYSEDMIMAGMKVPPKHALIFVQGYSDKIAEEYYKHMSAQTVSSTGTSVVATTRMQQYKLLNGQDLRMYYFAPVALNVYVKIKVNVALNITRTTEIKKAILNLSNTRQIGENYTQAYILDKLNPNIDYQEIIGVQLSVDGITWSNTTDFNEGNIGIIPDADYIVIEEPED